MINTSFKKTIIKSWLGPFFFPELKWLNINHEFCFIFIHIPKTAGTSVSSALNMPKSTHATLKRAEKAVPEIMYKSYFKFAFVRHPFDRFLSLYRYARLEESLYHSAKNPEKAPFGKHLDYDILKNASIHECAKLLKAGKLKHNHDWNHWQPQVYWLKNIGQKFGLDFIGRFENLEKDFEFVQKEIGIKTGLPVMNQSSKNTDDEIILDKETKLILSEYYKQDFEELGYHTDSKNYY